MAGCAILTGLCQFPIGDRYQQLQQTPRLAYVQSKGKAHGRQVLQEDEVLQCAPTPLGGILGFLCRFQWPSCRLHLNCFSAPVARLSESTAPPLVRACFALLCFALASELPCLFLLLQSPPSSLSVLAVRDQLAVGLNCLTVDHSCHMACSSCQPTVPWGSAPTSDCSSRSPNCATRLSAPTVRISAAKCCCVRATIGANCLKRPMSAPTVLLFPLVLPYLHKSSCSLRQLLCCRRQL